MGVGGIEVAVGITTPGDVGVGAGDVAVGPLVASGDLDVEVARGVAVSSSPQATATTSSDSTTDSGIRLIIRCFLIRYTLLKYIECPNNAKYCDGFECVK